MPRRNKRRPVRAESAGGEVYLRRLIAQQERDPSNDVERDSDVEAVDDDDASFLSVETEDSDDLDNIVEDLDDPPDRYDGVSGCGRTSSIRAFHGFDKVRLLRGQGPERAARPLVPAPVHPRPMAITLPAI